MFKWFWVALLEKSMAHSATYDDFQWEPLSWIIRIWNVIAVKITNKEWSIQPCLDINIILHYPVMFQRTDRFLISSGPFDHFIKCTSASATTDLCGALCILSNVLALLWNSAQILWLQLISIERFQECTIATVYGAHIAMINVANYSIVVLFYFF